MERIFRKPRVFHSVHIERINHFSTCDSKKMKYLTMGKIIVFLTTEQDEERRRGW